jgi:A/G-specific adenine glycosylase
MTVLPDAAWFRAFRRRLETWFDQHAKDLPWRRRSDAYAVWLSEVMLQQTQVATVCGYFTRFLQALPTVHDLARADEEQVLRLWEGLGYYRRARQLHRAAQVIVAEHGGEFPRDMEKARRLPGIGRYTAGAILSIAYDIPQPILEANTIRVYSRLLAFDGDPHNAAGQKLLWSMAEACILGAGVRSSAFRRSPEARSPAFRQSPREQPPKGGTTNNGGGTRNEPTLARLGPAKQPGRLNQALMELGREICKSRGPLCESCPAAALCRAYERGLQDRVPRPKAKPKIEEVCEAAVVVRRRGRVLLIKRGDGGRWAGLWDFPRFQLDGEHPAARHHELIEGVRKIAGIDVAPGELLKTLRHGVTRFRITLDCYAAEYVAETDGEITAEKCWVRPTELDGYPLSTTGRSLANIISQNGSR